MHTEAAVLIKCQGVVVFTGADVRAVVVDAHLLTA